MKKDKKKMAVKAEKRPEQKKIEVKKPDEKIVVMKKADKRQEKTGKKPVAAQSKKAEQKTPIKKSKKPDSNPKKISISKKIIAVTTEDPEKFELPVIESVLPAKPLEAIETEAITADETQPLQQADVEPETVQPKEIEAIVQINPLHDDDDDKNKIEALLFACGKYIDETSISELCSLDKRKVKKLLELLRKDYEDKNNALAIFQEGTSWKINVRERYLSIVRKIVTDTEINRSMMETLAVIAWKSPALQSDIVKTRGNKCYDHIDELEAQGFIAKEKKGRSYVLKTTEKFFSYFDIDQGNLKSVLEAVKVPELKEAQQTLNEPMKMDSSDKIKSIEILRKTESEEEKQFYNAFLSEIDARIGTAAEKNNLLEQEIPRPGLAEHGDIQPPFNDTAENPLVDNVTENSEVQAVQIDAAAQPTDIHMQEPKPKSLTKKQLEKKFKDELLRVREKMEKK